MDIVLRVTQEFGVKFDGEALAEHTMDIRALAPSLLALGDAIQAAYGALDEELVGAKTTPPTLQIRATREGSFSIDLLVATLAGSPTTAAANTLAVGGVVWGTVKGAINLLKRFRGEPPPEPESSDDNYLTYRDPDGHQLIVPVGSNILIEDGQFRAAINKFTQPLDVDGIDEVSISDSDTPDGGIRLTASDRPGFTIGLPETRIDSSERKARVHVETIQVNTDRGRKWRFSEDGETFTADVKDADFLLSIKSGSRSVGSADVLTVILREDAIRRPGGGIKLVRTIEHVQEHERAPVQGEFDFD